MKKEYRDAITKAIKESDLKGYKWTITENGLRWSYLTGENEEFTFDSRTEADFLLVHGPFCNMAAIWYEDAKYADCKTLTEAYYLATKATIRKANSIY
jgi:hypothetical protein